MRRRLVASMVGLVGVVLIAHDVPLALHLREIERDRLTTSVERDAFTIGGQISPLLTRTDPDRATLVAEAVDAFGIEPSSTVVVVDANGYLIASSDPTHSAGDDYATRPEIAAALLGNPSSGTRPSVTVGEDLVYVAVPVLSGADVLGAVRITYPKSVLDARVDEQLRGLLLAASVSIAMAVAVAVLFARTVSRPIEDLRRVTEQFASGDLDVLAPESGPRETRQLARSFNAMARRLGNLITRQRSFAGDASHQLRTPLTALRLRLEQASEVAPSDADALREHLDEALDESDRLGNLVEQLLRLARAEGSVLPANEFDLAELVNDRAKQWNYLAIEREIEIVAIDVPSIRVTASEFALREILDNYLDNAIDASPAGSRIEIIVIRGDNDLEIVVRDHGVGLTGDQRLRAFDRFWRAPENSNRRSGSGLGLAVVAQLADAAGMQVELRSSPMGGIDASVRVERN